MELIKYAVGEFWLGGLFIAVAATFVAAYHDIGRTDIERRQWIEFLLRDEFSGRYRFAITGLLDWIDRRLAQREIDVRFLANSGDLYPAVVNNKNSFGYAALDICFGFAIALPAVLFLAQNMFFPNALPSGEHLFQANNTLPSLAGVATLLVIMLGVYWAAFSDSRLERLGAMISDKIRTPMHFSAPISYLATLLWTAALAWLMSFSILGLLGFTMLFSAASAFVASFAFACGLLLFNDIFAAASLCIGTSFVAIILRRVLERSIPNTRDGLFLLFSFSSFVSFLFVAFGGEKLYWDHGAKFYFFVVLPSILSITTFLSISSTRILLRRGVQRGIVRYSALNLAVGLTLTFLSALVFIVVIDLTAYFSSYRFIELGVVLSGANTHDGSLPSPRNYLWIAASLSAPLIPPILQLLLAGGSALSLVPRSMRHWVAMRLAEAEEGRAASIRMGLAALAALVGLSVTLVVSIGYYGGLLVAYLMPEAGRWLIFQLNLWHQAIEALLRLL